MRRYLLLALFMLLSHDVYALDGVSMTKGFEGFRSTVYKDSLGIKHIGYGFNCEALNIDCTQHMDRQKADVIFMTEYNKAKKLAKRFAGFMWEHLPESKQVVLIDMAYNMSSKLFGFKKFRAAILEGNMRRASLEMQNSRWFRQVRLRGHKLVKLWEV